MPRQREHLSPGQGRVGTAKTVDSALQLLKLFNHITVEWTVGEAAKRLGVPYSTAYRYVSTLEEAGFIRRHSDGTYRLGLPLIELAGVALNQLDVRVQGLSDLDHLADVTGLNANMAIRDEGDTFHIAFAVRSEAPQMYSALGRRAVAHCTALGKVLLADLPLDEVQGLIDRYGWRPYTEKSIQDFTNLERTLIDVRSHGYALDLGERRLTTRCVAAPIHDKTGRAVAAISVSGHRNNLSNERLRDLAAVVMEHANRISYRLGYDLADPYAITPSIDKFGDM